MYLSSDIRDASGPINTGMNRGGWVHLQYGESGNVEVMTVRGECYDTASNACWDDTSLDEGARATHLVNNCDCARAHHYAYRWDELNRLAEARRYEWSSAGSQWDLMVRQRYRYDGANQRTVKETRDGTFAGDATGGVDRAALYVYPGDFERRGVSTDLMNAEWSPASTGNTESQYMVAGARVVWKDETHGMSGFEPDIRVTYALPNLIQSTTGVVDLISGELLERTTFYPNGARETLRTNTASAGAWGTEPLGFTGKEGDDEVGLTYFGERYLLQHLGRWASPDPLQVHAGGGGEFGNSYHYVGGNLLQAGIHSGWGQQDWSSQGRGGDRSSPPPDPSHLSSHHRSPRLRSLRRPRLRLPLFGHLSLQGSRRLGSRLSRLLRSSCTRRTQIPRTATRHIRDVSRRTAWMLAQRQSKPDRQEISSVSDVSRLGDANGSVNGGEKNDVNG